MTDAMKLSLEDQLALDDFRELLRIPSVSGDGANGSYRACAEFIVARCNRASVPTRMLEPVPGKPIVLATIRGSEPELPCIVLNSHYDVVPVLREHWSCDPFAAVIMEGYPADSPYVEAQHKENAGPCVYARGAQDMKCVVVQYLHAIHRLRCRSGGWQPRRTIHLSFVPDEEIGGTDGMCKLIASAEFESMKPIGLALDEGLANPRNALTLFYGERTQWWLLIRAEGPTGHGSRFIANTAMEKLMSVVNKALAFRKAQEQELAWDDQSSAGCAHCQAKKLGDVTTLNVTMLRSGVSLDGGKTFALNVIPATAEAGFDVRIAPELATAEFKKMLDAWCQDEGLSWRFVPWVETLEEHYVTKPSETPLFGVLEDALGKACPDVRVEREIFPAGTDSQFLRAVGIPAVGLSLLPNTPVLLHEHNESLSVATFLKGIATYCHVIDNLASAEQLPGEQQDGKCGQNGKKRKMLDGLDPDAS